MLNCEESGTVDHSNDEKDSESDEEGRQGQDN